MQTVDLGLGSLASFTQIARLFPGHLVVKGESFYVVIINSHMLIKKHGLLQDRLG